MMADEREDERPQGVTDELDDVRTVMPGMCDEAIKHLRGMVSSASMEEALALGMAIAALRARPPVEPERGGWIQAIATAVAMGNLTVSQEAIVLAHVNGYCEAGHEPLQGWDEAAYTKANDAAVDVYGRGEALAAARRLEEALPPLRASARPPAALPSPPAVDREPSEAVESVGEPGWVEIDASKDEEIAVLTCSCAGPGEEQGESMALSRRHLRWLYVEEEFCAEGCDDGRLTLGVRVPGTARSRSPGAEPDGLGYVGRDPSELVRDSWLRAIADAVVMGGLSASQEATALAHINGYCEPDNVPLPGWDEALYAKAKTESADLYGSPVGEDEPDEIRETWWAEYEADEVLLLLRDRPSPGHTPVTVVRVPTPDTQDTEDDHG